MYSNHLCNGFICYDDICLIYVFMQVYSKFLEYIKTTYIQTFFPLILKGQFPIIYILFPMIFTYMIQTG